MAALRKTNNMGCIFFWKTLTFIILCKNVYMLTNDIVDGCEDGWKRHDQHCFKVVNKTADWKTASYKCINMGGHLASIHSIGENDLMIELFMEFGSRYWWIGMHDPDMDGVYEWLDGSDIDYTNWRPAEPENYGFCVATSVYVRFGAWLAIPCIIEHPFPCQKKVGTSVTASAGLSDRTVATSVTASAGLSDRTVATSVTASAGLSDRTVATSVTASAGLSDRTVATSVTASAGLSDRTATSVTASAGLLSDRTGFLLITTSLLSLL